MQPAAPNRQQLQALIRERLRLIGEGERSLRQSAALNIFFELNLEHESLRDFKTLCVLVPDICLGTPASLYFRNTKGQLQLRRTTIATSQPLMIFPEPACPGLTSVIRHADFRAFPICEMTAAKPTQGLLCLHRQLDADEERFFARFSESIAKVFAVKQSMLSNRQRLAFINNLVRDIGHNVIVPNMHFKLLFLEMDKQLMVLGRKINDLNHASTDAAQRELKHELPLLAQDLRKRLSGISRRFKQSSLFLESLLRRSHFEKGRYELLLRPCKFKSQIFEPQIDRFRPLLQARGIDVQIHPDVRIDEDVTLSVDLGLISQVFANLLSNAVKYAAKVSAPDRQIGKALLYGWESQPAAFGPDGPGVHLFVSTTGLEIPQTDAQRLFDPDFRAEAANTIEGSGHGLFFVKQIVELHKGRVSYSHSNGMNTFHVVLPSPAPDRQIPEKGTCPNPS